MTHSLYTDKGCGEKQLIGLAI